MLDASRLNIIEDRERSLAKKEKTGKREKLAKNADFRAENGVFLTFFENKDKYGGVFIERQIENCLVFLVKRIK
jgi:hypothetical protein